MTVSRTLRIKLTATCTPLLAGLLIAVLNGTSVYAQEQQGNCGPLRVADQFGPYDYRTERGKNLHLVESAHFMPEVEALIRGNRGARVGAELDYTLRTFPNHHRALLAMVRLSEKLKSPAPDGARYTVECWFTRAIQFAPDDTTVLLLFAEYLGKNNRQSEATKQLEWVTVLAKENGFTYYNIGLVYFDMKLYDRALASAHRALALGFDRTELRNRLESVGQWKEPSATPAPAN